MEYSEHNEDISSLEEDMLSIVIVDKSKGIGAKFSAVN